MVSFLVEATLQLPLWAEPYLLMPNQTSVSSFARLKLFYQRNGNSYYSKLLFLGHLRITPQEVITPYNDYGLLLTSVIIVNV